MAQAVIKINWKSKIKERFDAQSKEIKTTKILIFVLIAIGIGLGIGLYLK